MAVSANRLELLQIADAVAREKAIDRSIVITAMEDAIQKAARSRYGSETEVRAEINPKTGELRLSRLLLVVDQVENDATQIALEDAKKRNPAAQVGDYIAEALPPLEYGRIAAQSAKQVIVQKVREAERDRQYQEYKDRISDIVNGIVKRVEYGNVVVDLGRGEAIVRRDEMLPRETFRNGDRIRAFIYDVRREPRGPQIFLSRTHPQFMSKLFARAECPARFAAHRLGHRYRHRAGGIGAPPGRIQETHEAVHRGAQRRRGGRPVARFGRIQLGRGACRGRRKGTRRDRGFRRRHRARIAGARPRLSRPTRSRARRQAQTARRRGCAQRDPGRHHRHAGEV